MAKFTLAPSAQIDLDEIWDYISERNEAAANKFIEDLARKFQLLAENREIGKRQDDFMVEMRMFPFKKYHIYGIPSADGVEIYRVLHCARDIVGIFDDFV